MERVLGDLMCPPGSSRGQRPKTEGGVTTDAGARERAGEAGSEDAEGAVDQQEASRSLGGEHMDSPPELPEPIALQTSFGPPLLKCKITSFPGGSDGKVSFYNAGDLGSIPGSGRSPGEGNGNPLQHSCLENPMDGGA